mmetsp:Transcript_19654/g.39847  ORF Transcript_19654/g.39847 Transcript_19654/m.39847 type:complete len:299 (-) Transcript_19654:17-913(-)
MVSTRIPLLVRALLPSSLLLLFLIISVAAAGKAKRRREIRNTEQYADICTSLNSASYPPIEANDKRRHSVLSALIDASGLQNLLAADGPRLRSACWILYDDPAKLSTTNKSRLLERYALVVLYHASQGGQWASSKNWLSKSDVGKWEGVTTSRPRIFSLHKHVTNLVLPFNAMNGILPRELSLLRQLHVVDLRGNDLQGVLPAKALSELKRLEVMDLSMNNILGRIPTEIGLVCIAHLFVAAYTGLIVASQSLRFLICVHDFLFAHYSIAMTVKELEGGISIRQLSGRTDTTTRKRFI